MFSSRVIKVRGDFLKATPIRKEVDDAVSAIFKDSILFSANMNYSLIFLRPIYNIKVIATCYKVLKDSIPEYWSIGVLEY